jgi:hypothetical protein
MDAAAMTDSYVGYMRFVSVSPGIAVFKIRIPRRYVLNGYVDVRLQTTSKDLINQLISLQYGALIEVSATPSPASAPGEPYIATRLTVLDAALTEP